MLRGTAMSERVREQALSTVECDIPRRLSIEEYRRKRVRPVPAERWLLRRLRALRRTPAL
jgi:hypothetical protein